MSDLSDGFNVFVDQYRAHADGTVQQLMELGRKLSDLARQYNDARRDLEGERVARRHAQELVESLEKKFKGLEELTMRGAFVLVLVDADADAYLFDDKYYAGDPAEGGKLAAIDLRAAVQQYVKAVDPRLGGFPIMARAFASWEGLATLLAKAGMATPGDSQLVLSQFICGFSQADELFDFVLVGKGKDRADNKLMGAFRQFVESPSCQHVLLACCHDNGYVRMLEKCVHNQTLVKKVTMITSFQTGNEFTGLPFPRTTMNAVFRAHPLSPVGGSKPGTQRSPANAAAAPANGHPVPVSAIIPPSSSGAGNIRSSPPATYASRAAAQDGTAPHLSSPRPLPFFGSLDKTIILINADGHRIDMPLPPKSAKAADTFSRKTHVERKRFCNMYHLYGSCSKVCESGYLHDPLTAGEKLVMRHGLRKRECLDGGKCRDPLCFYGHHCTCLGPGKKCNFPAAMHGVDVTSWREVDARLAG